MNRMVLLTAWIAAVSMLAPPQAHAWGKTGHRVTGEIAQRYLSPTARDRVAAILGVEDLAEASTWPDFMRSSPDEYWRRTANPYHYVTIPPGETYEAVGAPPQGDAISALAGFRATLRDPDASIENKRLALRFTVHLIGDLHQPLHAGNGSDRGGNDFKVTFFDEPTNLHRVWDEHLVDYEQLSYTEFADWLLRRLTAGQVEAWSQVDPVVWVTESAALREDIYPAAGEALRYDYIFEHRAAMRTRLMQAGVRMAAYLNDVFAPDR